MWAVNNKVTSVDDLEHFFFQSTDIDSTNGINGLLQQLSWWDVNTAKPVDPTGPRYKEFFVLEAQLNLLKGQVCTLLVGVRFLANELLRFHFPEIQRRPSENSFQWQCRLDNRLPIPKGK